VTIIKHKRKHERSDVHNNYDTHNVHTQVKLYHATVTACWQTNFCRVRVLYNN